MEASVAGQGGDAGQQADGQGQGDGGIGQLQAQMDALAGGVGELQQFLQSQPWQQAQADEGQQQDDGMDLSFLTGDPSLDPGYDPQQAAAQLQQAVDQRVQQALTQHLTPLQQQLSEERISREAGELVAEFPELGQDEVAQQTVSLARQMAEQLGRPELANEPKFWRMAFLSAKAADAANTEGAETPQAAHLEGGAGATQGGPSQVDLAQQFKANLAQAAQGGRAALPFH